MFEMDMEKQELPRTPTTPTGSLHDDVGERIPPPNGVAVEKEVNSSPPGQVNQEVVLAWDGSDDPDNPRNWPFRKRAFNTALPAIYAFLITLCTSVYVPAIPIIQAQFGVSQQVALLGLSLYAIGIGLGPLVAAPLSELYGRKNVYLTTLLFLLAFTAGAGAAQNIQTLLICRFLAGTGGSGAIAIGAGTVADIWDLAKDGGPASLLFTLGPYLGTTVGYLTGAYIIAEYNYDWRYSMWVLLFVGAPVMIASLFTHETSWKHIIIARLKSRGTPIAAHPNPLQELRRKLSIALVRPVHMMFTEPLVGYISLFTGFAWAMIFSFFASYSYVFATVYGFDEKSIGLAFLGLLPGFISGIVIFGLFDKTMYAKARVAADGKPAPEHRLYAAMIGGVMVPISLFWFAWSSWSNVHWIVPILSGIPFGIGMMTIFLSSVLYLLDVYRSAAGASAIAANGILRYGLGAVFPHFTGQMYHSLGVHWAGSVFAFASLLLMPIPWIFFKYGKILRARSNYETSDY